jgi:predicted nucleotidyltransferase
MAHDKRENMEKVNMAKSNDIENINKVISKLKKSRFVHSIILFGSRARGTEKEKSDIDICIIPKPDIEVSLKDRIALNNLMPENIDVSLFDDLPVYIRKRVFLEGRVLYTEDMYHILTLAKINDLEYERYKSLKQNYHENVMKRVIAKLG